LDKSLGKAMKMNDCEVITDKVGRLPACTMPFFDRRAGITNYPTLPQGDHHRTCAIGLDKINHNAASVNLDPVIIRDAMRLLDRYCVVTWGFGGTVTFRGTEFELTNPAEGLTRRDMLSRA